MGLCLRRLMLQYPWRGGRVRPGISGNFQPESVATFDWNRWQGSTGISGNLRAEYAIGRIRLCKIGSSADVEEVWSIYHCIARLLGEPREEIWGSLTVSARGQQCSDAV